MAKYQITFSKGAVKDFENLPEEYKVLVRLSLNKLSEGEPKDIKHIKGEKDTYRLRVGRYRVLYLKIDLTLLVTKIASRQGAYK